MNDALLNAALWVFTVAMALVAVEYTFKLAKRLNKGYARVIERRIDAWQDELDKIYANYDETFEIWWVGDGLNVAKPWAFRQTQNMLEQLHLPDPSLAPEIIRETLETSMQNSIETVMQNYIEHAHIKTKRYALDRLTSSTRKLYERKLRRLSLNAGRRQRVTEHFQEYDQHMVTHVEDLKDIGYDIQKLNETFPIQ